MTTNERYKGLNNRFENRARVLRKIGFKYTHIAEYGIAVFVPPGKAQWGKDRTKKQTIPATLVMHSNKTEWIDTLSRSLLRH